jgi:hypothetical protein
MQSPSARDGDQHRFSCALMTIQQYQKMREANENLPSVRKHVEYISKFVPRESPLFGEILEMLKQLE